MWEYILLALGVVILMLQIVLLLRGGKGRQNEEQDRRLREELANVRRDMSESTMNLQRQLSEQQRTLMQLLGEHQKESLRTSAEQQDRLYRSLNQQSEQIRTTLAEAVGKLQESNEQKLEQMRQTVDEKLTGTLTQRLDSSFKTVGDQLKDVYTSLGEMKKLAGGVSDLQRALTNVKVRGTWAEVQLGSLLEQTLTPEQYERNVSVRNNREAVEFAVKIPSRDNDERIVWLPIDSKFPQEDFLRLSEAADQADKAAVEEAAHALEQRIKGEAKTISDLYICPPATTDFAIMFLPTEGLFAEVLRRPGLAEEIQRKYRVMVCGPTTITAFLNTLRMGFRTIALDKRAAEVWKILGAAKAQYETFETVLAKAHKKIEEAGNTLEDARKRNRTIRSKLRDVVEMDSTASTEMLGTGTEEETVALPE